MKKKRWNFRCWRIPGTKQLCRIMKLTSFLLFALFFQVSAGVFSQSNGRLSLKAEKESVNNILKLIEEQTDFRFMYNANNINVERRIDINCNSKSITEVLEMLFEGTNVKYRSFNNNYVLFTDTENATGSAEQQKTVTGKVTDSSGNSLPGVSIVLKGTTTGVITDVDGKYSLSKIPNNATLVFSFVGMKTIEVNIGNQNVINVVMRDETIGINEVVVTALGISREKKGLGYAVQEIKGDQLNVARETNFVNSLAGKVAGVNIVSGGAVGSSSRITMRGESSLSLQSNQPLFVVDGVPMGNDGVSNSTSADYGNSSGEVNPADVESMTVLKGPAASALYGSRAANGAIVIVTKSGKQGKGIGVSVNSGTTFETLLRLPKFQNKFGQGNNGIYVGSNFGKSSSIYPDGINDSYDESWGPRLDVGTTAKQYFSPTTGGMRGGDVDNPNRGDIIETPWVSRPNNIRDFFGTGHTYYNNVALTGSNEKGDFRISYTNLDEKGVIPNNNLTRNTVAFKSNYKLTDKIRVNVSADYVKTSSTNRPDNGYGRNTFMYFVTWFGRNCDMNALKDYWQTGLDGIKQFQYNYGENHNNPFFLQYENTKGQNKDRLYGNISLNYDITSKLSLMGRVGTDVYNDFRPMKWAVSTVSYEKGSYREDYLFYQEQNYDFLLTWKDRVGQDFNYRASLGGNSMDRRNRYRSVVAPTLLIPGLYSIANSASTLQSSSNTSHKRINSLYAFTQMDYKSTYYLDLTFRNDWSSTLPSSTNSYFYPSVSFSTLVDKIVTLPHWVDQAKVRMGLASVGNDTNPYSLRSTYSFVTPSWGDSYALSSGSTLPNTELKPEKVFTYEFGTEVKLFDNRVNLDMTYYDIRSKNQIIQLPLAISSGYGSRMINAGEIQNKGFEIMLNVVPVRTTDFKWDATINFSTNRGKVLKLVSGVDKIVQAAEAEDVATQAVVGERTGALYGPGYQRVSEGPMKGQIIIGSNGAPLATSSYIRLGNANPDWIGSLSNEFMYKNFSLGVLVDIHYGGEFVSRFYNKANGAGQLVESLKGREARPVGQEYSSNYYIEGAALVNGQYVANSTSTDGTYSTGVYGTSARAFIKKMTDHIPEGQLFDATYMKLREVKLGYSIPSKVFNHLIKDVTVALVGRNLLLWTPKSNQHFDPEVSVATSGNGLVPGQENMALPSTRSFGFNVSFKF